MTRRPQPRNAALRGSTCDLVAAAPFSRRRATPPRGRDGPEQGVPTNRRPTHDRLVVAGSDALEDDLPADQREQSAGYNSRAGVLSVNTDAPLTPSGAMTAGTPRAVLSFATRGFRACGENGIPAPRAPYVNALRPSQIWQIRSPSIDAEPTISIDNWCDCSPTMRPVFV